MLLVSGWMATVPSSLPLPAVNFSLSIPAFRGDERRGQPARYYPLLITVPENCFPRGSPKRRVCNADNAQLPAYSGLQLPVCNAQKGPKGERERIASWEQESRWRWWVMGAVVACACDAVDGNRLGEE